MLHLPSALRTAFETCLWNAAIPKPAHAAYTKWLRYYLDFCQKHHFGSTTFNRGHAASALAGGRACLGGRPRRLTATQGDSGT